MSKRAEDEDDKPIVALDDADIRILSSYVRRLFSPFFLSVRLCSAPLSLVGSRTV